METLPHNRSNAEWVRTGGLTVSDAPENLSGFLFSHPIGAMPIFVNNDVIPDLLYFFERNHTSKAIYHTLIPYAREEPFFYLLGKNSQSCNSCRHRWDNQLSERKNCPKCNASSEKIESKLQFGNQFGNIEIISRKSGRNGFAIRQANSVEIQIYEPDFDEVIKALAPAFDIEVNSNEMQICQTPQRSGKSNHATTHDTVKIKTQPSSRKKHLIALTIAFSVTVLAALWLIPDTFKTYQHRGAGTIAVYGVAPHREAERPLLGYETVSEKKFKVHQYSELKESAIVSGMVLLLLWGTWWQFYRDHRKSTTKEDNTSITLQIAVPQA